MASSDEMRAPTKTHIFDLEGDHGTQPEPKEPFLVAVVAVQTFWTPPKYADAVAQLLASTDPRRLCQADFPSLVPSLFSGVWFSAAKNHG